MQKIVINVCHGGFGLSEKARNILSYVKYDHQLDRACPELVAVVEKLGDEANGSYAKLKVVEVPDDVQCKITEYDGWEQVEEVHRIWN